MQTILPLLASYNWRVRTFSLLERVLPLSVLPVNWTLSCGPLVVGAEWLPGVFSIFGDICCFPLPWSFLLTCCSFEAWCFFLWLLESSFLSDVFTWCVIDSCWMASCFFCSGHCVRPVSISSRQKLGTWDWLDLDSDGKSKSVRHRLFTTIFYNSQ